MASKANSSTKRIETCRAISNGRYHATSKANSSTKRIETCLCPGTSHIPHLFKGQFQYKKDWNSKWNSKKASKVPLQRPIPVQKGLKLIIIPRLTVPPGSLQRPIPVQKGLKPQNNQVKTPGVPSSKANSSTKRIETQQVEQFVKPEHQSSKANSSTKRIETNYTWRIATRWYSFKGQFQYKKDWNISTPVTWNPACWLQRPIPVQKGLKHAGPYRTHLPGKPSKANSSTKRIETSRNGFSNTKYSTSKANSSTKRIETKIVKHGPPVDAVKIFKGQFQYKKDWNTSVWYVRMVLP